MLIFRKPICAKYICDWSDCVCLFVVYFFSIIHLASSEKHTLILQYTHTHTLNQQANDDNVHSPYLAAPAATGAIGTHISKNIRDKSLSGRS